jgi:hypothetical protein
VCLFLAFKRPGEPGHRFGGNQLLFAGKSNLLGKLLRLHAGCRVNHGHGDGVMRTNECFFLELGAK